MNRHVIFYSWYYPKKRTCNYTVVDFPIYGADRIATVGKPASLDIFNRIRESDKMYPSSDVFVENGIRFPLAMLI